MNKLPRDSILQTEALTEYVITINYKKRTSDEPSIEEYLYSYGRQMKFNIKARWVG